MVKLNQLFYAKKSFPYTIHARQYERDKIQCHIFVIFELILMT